MRYAEILLERVLNLHTSEQKMKYADRVWSMLQRSYEKLGGFKSASSVEELANEPGYWKIVRRGDRITAVGIYKKVPASKNFKVIASAAETQLDPETGKYRTTKQGLRDYNKIKDEDIKTRRSWAEVSGPAERIMLRSGAKPISNRYAEILTGKSILDLNDDGYHYTRLIQGEPHEKILVGFVELSKETQEELAKKHFSFGELPPNIELT